MGGTDLMEHTDQVRYISAPRKKGIAKIKEAVVTYKTKALISIQGNIHRVIQEIANRKT